MLDTICSISVALSNTKDSHDKVRFQVLEPQPFRNLGQVLSSRTWSPHIWRDDYRANKNWLNANFIALDFDSGFPLLETIKICQHERLTFLIGTTKSHQLEKISQSGKVTPPMDRYRLAILTDGPCDDKETYRNTLDYFGLFLPIDESCKDLARYFFPCKEIVHMEAGKLCAWIPLTEEQIARREKAKALRKERLAENRGSGIIPSWILSAIKQTEHPIGTRHKTCYRIGAEMCKLGFDEDYIERLVMNSTLNVIGGEDVRRAVRNGISKARNYWQENEGEVGEEKENHWG